MNGQTSSQTPIAEIITQLAIRIAEQSEVLSEKTHVKLQSIMTDSEPTPIKEEADRVFLPFTVLNKSLRRIQTSLYSIEDALSRTGL